MKKLVLGSVMSLVLFTIGCIDDIEIPEQKSFAEQLEIDQELITQYLQDNNITALEDSVYGLRYVMHVVGNENNPTVDDEIVVSYAGRVMGSPTNFDAGDTIPLLVNRLIPAWQILVPYMGEGGSMTMYVPSGYAYGPARVGPIPANSILEFDLDLVTFLK